MSPKQYQKAIDGAIDRLEAKGLLSADRGDGCFPTEKGATAMLQILQNHLGPAWFHRAHSIAANEPMCCTPMIQKGIERFLKELAPLRADPTIMEQHILLFTFLNRASHIHEEPQAV